MVRSSQDLLQPPTPRHTPQGLGCLGPVPTPGHTVHPTLGRRGLAFLRQQVETQGGLSQSLGNFLLFPTHTLTFAFAASEQERMRACTRTHARMHHHHRCHHPHYCAVSPRLPPPWTLLWFSRHLLMNSCSSDSSFALFFWAGNQERSGSMAQLTQ